ncbi:MAG: flagellar FliJ family protein [Ignavibacteriales bacterium]|nr:flagellar FliJ family protein [Ignavibacteriales bacterium]
MAKFQYKYESIKNVKKSLEKKAQKELAAFDFQIELIKKEIIDLELKKNQIKINTEENKTIKISEVHTKIYYESFLDEAIKTFKDKMIIVEKERAEKLNELISKSKEYKIFKTLENKEQQDFLIEDNKTQQIQMDDISVQKFARGKN